MSWQARWQPGDALYSHYEDDTGDGHAHPEQWDDCYGRAIMELVDDVHQRQRCFICDSSYKGHPGDPTDPEEILQTCMRDLGGCGQKHGIQCPVYDNWRQGGEED